MSDCGCCCVSTGKVCKPGGNGGDPFVPAYSAITLPEDVDESGDPIPIPVTLIDGVWTTLLLSVPGPNANLVQALPTIAFPVGFAGDYDIEFCLSLSVPGGFMPALSSIQAAIFVAGPSPPDPGPIWPTRDWNDFIFDPFDTRMFGLQGGTLQTFQELNRIAIALRADGANADALVYTASLEAVKVSHP